MKRLTIFSLIVVLLALIVAGCGGAAQDEVATATNTQPPAETPTPTRKPTKTPIMVGPAATARALTELITLVPPTESIGVVDPEDYVGMFEQAWNIVNNNYVRDDFNGADWDAIHEEYLPQFQAVDNQQDFWALMSALIAELDDSHSRFVPPTSFAAEFDIETSDSTAVPWTGLMVWPAKEDDRMLIWYVCETGAGAAAGLQRGDEILAINGEAMTPGEDGFTREQRILALYGDGSSDQVTLTVLQGADSQPQDFTLTLSGASECYGWDYELVSTEPRIGYIQVPEFSGNAAFNILQAINAMEAEQPLDGLIVDIRHNPGGRSDDSIRIFAQGVYGSEGALREGELRSILNVRGPVDWNETTPLVVLTDGNSHSASDYFAAAMRVLGRATLIGMPSAGNTEGITGFNLADSSIIRLAVSALLLEDGSSIEGVGIIPDIQVPLGEWGLRQTPYDIQLQAAIDYLIDLLS